MKREEIDKRFEKLSDTNKIRYNLGDIMLCQNRSVLTLGIMGILIFSYLLFSPLFIRYAGLSRILMLAVGGLLMLIAGFILFFYGNSKLNKVEKRLEEFLNKKSKK